VGLHEYQGQKLDEQLDDISPASLDRQRRFYEKFRDRLSSLKLDQLGPEDRADLTILQNQVSLALMEATEIRSHLHNPTMYVETLGNALFTPYVLEYAPKPERVRHIMARLQQVPLFLDQAASNLASSPDIWTKVAIEENDGNFNLVDKEIRGGVRRLIWRTPMRARRRWMRSSGGGSRPALPPQRGQLASGQPVPARKFRRRYRAASKLTPPCNRRSGNCKHGARAC
jgi:hypothetical protein